MKLTFGGDVKRTFCTLCPQHCGMLVKVENGRPVRFDGDRNNPVAKGKLCIKGTACIELNEHPDRLNFPLKRIGDRGSDQWEQISWEQALDEIAAKLSDIRDREGPEALATLGGTHKSPGDWSSWRFASHFGTPNFVSQGRNCGVGEFLTETAMYGWDTVYQAPHPGRHEVRRDLGLEPGRVVAAVLGAAQGLPGAGSEADRDRPARDEDGRARRPPPPGPPAHRRRPGARPRSTS